MTNHSKNNFPRESAGKIATDKVPVFSPGRTIKELVEYLNKNMDSFESVDYVYILNQRKKLTGVVSIKEVLASRRGDKISSVMHKKPFIVHPSSDREKVAYLSLKHNIKAVPVVDDSQKFLGAVLSDTILDVLYQEMHEDIAHLAGSPANSGQSAVDMSAWSIVKHRLPWLFLGLLGGVVAARIVGFFENTLSENIILASFIPLVMYMGGAALSQTQAFFIRDLAFKEDFPFLRYILKQTGVTALIALVLGSAFYFISFLFFGSSQVNVVIAVSIFAVLCTTVITSLFIPLFFLKLKKDPADGSGPVSTIIQDILGVVIYFLIASWLLLG